MTQYMTVQTIFEYIFPYSITNISDNTLCNLRCGFMDVKAVKRRYIINLMIINCPE